jgi:hypothetical protein
MPKEMVNCSGIATLLFLMSLLLPVPPAYNHATCTMSPLRATYTGSVLPRAGHWHIQHELSPDVVCSSANDHVYIYVLDYDNGTGTGSADLLDEWGTQIRCTFFREGVEKFFELIQPGNVYFFTNGT